MSADSACKSIETNRERLPSTVVWVCAGFVAGWIAVSNQSYWIDDPYDYRLPEAYGEYRWVRYYNDALLVDIYTGEVVDVVYDIFY